MAPEGSSPIPKQSDSEKGIELTSANLPRDINSTTRDDLYALTLPRNEPTYDRGTVNGTLRLPQAIERLSCSLRVFDPCKKEIDTVPLSMALAARIETVLAPIDIRAATVAPDEVVVRALLGQSSMATFNLVVADKLPKDVINSYPSERSGLLYKLAPLLGHQSVFVTFSSPDEDFNHHQMVKRYLLAWPQHVTFRNEILLELPHNRERNSEPFALHQKVRYQNFPFYDGLNREWEAHLIINESNLVKPLADRIGPNFGIFGRQISGGNELQSLIESTKLIRGQFNLIDLSNLSPQYLIKFLANPSGIEALAPFLADNGAIVVSNACELLRSKFKKIEDVFIAAANNLNLGLNRSPQNIKAMSASGTLARDGVVTKYFVESSVADSGSDYKFLVLRGDGIASAVRRFIKAELDSLALGITDRVPCIKEVAKHFNLNGREVPSLLTRCLSKRDEEAYFNQLGRQKKLLAIETLKQNRISVTPSTKARHAELDSYLRGVFSRYAKGEISQLPLQSEIVDRFKIGRATLKEHLSLVLSPQELELYHQETQKQLSALRSDTFKKIRSHDRLKDMEIYLKQQLAQFESGKVVSLPMRSDLVKKFHLDKRTVNEYLAVIFSPEELRSYLDLTHTQRKEMMRACMKVNRELKHQP